MADRAGLMDPEAFRRRGHGPERRFRFVATAKAVLEGHDVERGHRHMLFAYDLLMPLAYVFRIYHDRVVCSAHLEQAEFTAYSMAEATIQVAEAMLPEHDPAGRLVEECARKMERTVLERKASRPPVV